MTRLAFLVGAFVVFTLVGVYFGRLGRVGPRWRLRLGAVALAGMFLSALSALSAILFPEVLVVPSVRDIWGTCSAAFRTIVTNPGERWPSILAGLMLAVLLGRFVWAVVGGLWATRRAYVRGSEPSRKLDAGQGVYVLSVDHPEAFSVGGFHGQVVVTRGLLALLEEEERRAVLLHEEGHLRGRHHLLLSLATAASTALGPYPPAALALTGLEQASEESADDYAAAKVGSRITVASGLTKAALAGLRRPAGVPSLGNGPDVPARVRRLLDAPTPGWWIPALSLTTIAILLSLLLGTQIVGGFAILGAAHHLLGIGTAVMCRIPR